MCNIAMNSIYDMREESGPVNSALIRSALARTRLMPLVSPSAIERRGVPGGVFCYPSEPLASLTQAGVDGTAG